MTNKKTLLTFAGIYLFLYIFNYLHPMSFGDDYIYSFVWQGNSMFVPLTEDAVRVTSLKDIFVSQWLHYFTWGGRTVAHVLAQFFLWLGKDIFNFFNAFVGTLLVAEIYWCIHKGKIEFNCKPFTLCWIFFLLWTFTPGFSSVFLWLTASCNYLWSAVLLLGFTIPYIWKYYEGELYAGLFFKIGIFILGLLAGWTNENSVCWIILFTSILLYRSFKERNLENWMIVGLSGLLAGYTLLMIAPGNVVRLSSYGDKWFTEQMLKNNLHMLVVVLTFQLLLWYFNLRSIYNLKRMTITFNNLDLNKDFILVKLLCIAAFGASAIMIFSPVFPARSSFFGTILLIIIAGILLRIQKDYKTDFIQSGAKKFLFYLGAVYFIVSVVVSLNQHYRIQQQMQEILKSACQIRIEKKDKILVVNEFQRVSKLEDLLSGFHIPDYILSDNENDWKNVDFARYYDIKGIRMISEKRK